LVSRRHVRLVNGVRPCIMINSNLLSRAADSLPYSSIRTLSDRLLFRRPRCFFSSRRRSFAPLLTLLLFYRDLPQRFPHRFTKPLYRQFPIDCLAAGLLRYDPEHSVFSDPVLQAAHDELFPLRRKAPRVHHVEPQRNASVRLVNIVNNLRKVAGYGLKSSFSLFQGVPGGA